MVRGYFFVSVLAVTIPTGFLHPTPLDDLTINLNLNESPKGYEEDASDVSDGDYVIRDNPIVGNPGIQSGEWKAGQLSSKDPICRIKNKNELGKQMDSRRKRVLNGKEYKPHGLINEEPDWENWSASIKITDKQKVDWQCGGVLISKQLILTNLHCIWDDWEDNNSTYFISKDNVIIYFDRFETHFWRGITFKPKQYFYINEDTGKPEFLPGGNKKQVKDDIMGIKLDRPIRQKDCLKYIPISTIPGLPAPELGKFWFAGWGTYQLNPDKDPFTLQYTNELPSIPCPDDPSRFEPTNMCFKNTRRGVATCSGDSGSPGVITINGKMGPKWHVQAILSRGSDCHQREGESIFLDVYQYRDKIEKWIKLSELP